MIFLSADELARLTGRDQTAAQRRYLTRKQIPHDVNAIGEILVSRSYIERRLSGAAGDSGTGEFRPNFERVLSYASKA